MSPGSESVLDEKDMEPFMQNPFCTKHLIYRAVEVREDEAVFAAVFQDPVAHRQTSNWMLRPQSRQDAHDCMKRIAENSICAAVICLPGVEPSTSPIPIGWIRLKSPPKGTEHHRSAEIGVNIADPHAGKGYGSEAINWILDWGFTTAGLHRICVVMYEYNVRAHRLYKRLGFVQDAYRRESIWAKGKWWAEIELSMLEQEWRERQKGADADAGIV